MPKADSLRLRGFARPQRRIFFSLAKTQRPTRRGGRKGIERSFTILSPAYRRQVSWLSPAYLPRRTGSLRLSGFASPQRRIFFSLAKTQRPTRRGGRKGIERSFTILSPAYPPRRTWLSHLAADVLGTLPGTTTSFYLSFNTCPTRIRSLLRLFNLFSVETLTPYFAAISESVSPRFTL